MKFLTLSKENLPPASTEPPQCQPVHQFCSLETIPGGHTDKRSLEPIFSVRSFATLITLAGLIASLSPWCWWGQQGSWKVSNTGYSQRASQKQESPGTWWGRCSQWTFSHTLPTSRVSLHSGLCDAPQVATAAEGFPVFHTLLWLFPGENTV